MTAAGSGVVEYLENGIKNGRDLSRDELDQRVCIDGNIELTETLINAISDSDRDNYYHITLSFKERDIDTETIEAVYKDFKSKLLVAYETSEYNVYAEIHHPKVKNYEDARTGELIERLPHVHMVIPKRNLVTNRDFNPFGEYKKMEHYHDSIQESCNYKFNLSSPYDAPRQMASKAELISRYKGDNFSGQHLELKSQLLDTVHNENIVSWDGLKNAVSKYGVVSEANTPNGKYLKLKLPDAKKNIRLKESCFSEQYLTTREYRVNRPSEKQVQEKLDVWLKKASFENKHIVKANPVFRKEYYSANDEQQHEILKDRIEKYEQRYNLGKRRRQNSDKFSFKSNRVKTFAEISNGLPSMSKRNVVNRINIGSARTESVLSNNANNNLDNQRERQHNNVRRVRDWGSGRGSVINQVKHDSKQNKTELSENDLFAEVKDNLEPRYLFAELEKYKINEENYQISKLKDGSYKIAVGKRNLNVSDFLTKHVNLSWEDSKIILLRSYEKQQENILTNEDANCIIIGLDNKPTFKYTVYDSIKVYKHLLNIENNKDYSMSALEKLKKLKAQEENQILPKHKTLSFNELFKQQKLQEELSKSIKFKDLVATKDLKKGAVKYNNVNDGKLVFVDKGDRIHFADKRPANDAVLNGLKMAAEKFGTVKLSGTPEFKLAVLEQAAKGNVKVLFSPDSLQKEYEAIKTQLANVNAITKAEPQAQNNQDVEAEVKDKSIVQDNESVESEQTTVKGNVQQDSPLPQDNEDIQQDKPTPLEEAKEPIVLTGFGSAPYLNDEKNKDSYYATLSNGKTLWGVGLSDAIQQSNAKIGDEVQIQKVGKESVTVEVEIKDKDGNVTGTESKEVERAMWNVQVKEREAAKEVESQIKQSSEYKLTYAWNKAESVLEPKLNGQSIKDSEVSREFIEKLQEKDAFLQNFTADEIEAGKLSYEKAYNGAEARSLTVDSNGDKVESAPKVQDESEQTL